MAVLGFEQITGLSAVKSLTVPAGADKALLQAESQNVRYRLDAENPTTSVGLLIISGAAQPTEIHGNLADVRLIEDAASATLNVTYFGQST